MLNILFFATANKKGMNTKILTIDEAYKNGLKGFTLKTHGQKFIVIKIEQKQAHCINCTTTKISKIWSEKLTAQTFEIKKNDPQIIFLQKFHRINLFTPPQKTETNEEPKEENENEVYNWGEFQQ